MAEQGNNRKVNKQVNGIWLPVRTVVEATVWHHTKSLKNFAG